LDKNKTCRRGNNLQVKTLGRTIGDTMKQDGKIKGRPLTTKLWASMLHRIKRLNPRLHEVRIVNLRFKSSSVDGWS